MTEYILILNVGSSSIKFALYPKLEDKAAVLSGSIRDIARLPVFRVKRLVQLRFLTQLLRRTMSQS